jgi:hypothetical protein
VCTVPVSSARAPLPRMNAGAPAVVAEAPLTGVRAKAATEAAEPTRRARRLGVASLLSEDERESGLVEEVDEVSLMGAMGHAPFRG